MRTYEEIEADITIANRNNDAAALRTLAHEMQVLGTPHADAAAHGALGSADQINGNGASAIEHYHRTVTLLERIGDDLGVASVSNNMGNVYVRMSDYPTAMESFLRAIDIYKELDDRSGVAIVTGNMGNVFEKTGDFPNALEHFRRALAHHEDLGDKKGVAINTGNIGNVYHSTGDFSLALEYLRRALVEYEELGDRYGVANINVSIGNVYDRIGDYPTALEYFLRAMPIYEEMGVRYGVAVVTGNIGGVYAYTGDYPSALEHLHRALVHHEALGDRAGVARITSNIGNVYIHTRDYPSALEHYQRALTIYEELGDRHGATLVTGNIGNVHQRAGDIASALEHYHLALASYKEVGDRHGIANVVNELIDALLDQERFQDAADVLEEHSSSLDMSDPIVRSRYSVNRARCAEHAEDLEAARDHLMEALDIVIAAGLRPQAAEFHQRLRDLAQKRNDFTGYIEHNNEYNRITEEIRGKEATQRLTMMEAERRIEAELRERDKERALLYGALPESVATRMVRGERVSGDHFDHAAVLFADVVSFTTHTADMDPSDVVMLLDGIFASFDALCEQHGVMKVKTIGDSYMCFKGDASAEENAHAVALLARQATTADLSWPDGEPLTLRIGLHIGPATAGVIGTQRLQYDVWGDTVNVASRMESTGEPGRIHVSDELARSLDPGTWNLVLRGETAVKGKGSMTTYWLEQL